MIVPFVAVQAALTLLSIVLACVAWSWTMTTAGPILMVAMAAVVFLFVRRRGALLHHRHPRRGR